MIEAPGKGTTFLRAVRLAALRSNRSLMRGVYLALYRGLAWAMMRHLRARFPAHLEAVFLRGSLAMDLLVPGLSDIDLFIVLHDSVTPENHEELKARYAQLARRLAVFDPLPWVLRWAEIQKLYVENPSLRFRVLEGRQAFHCIYGQDRLGELPAPAPHDVALAQLFDLKSRLTYFNAFCLTPSFTDELEARRKEYLLFKLTVELSRIALFVFSEAVIFQRRQVIDRFLSGDAPLESALGLGDDRLLREFVAYTTGFRLCRSFCTNRGIALDLLEARLLRAALELCAQFYRRNDMRAAPELAAEHDHFYADGRFLPASRRVRRIEESHLADYARLKTDVLSGNAAEIDTVLCYGDLLINLSNADPRLGNCTVVSRPQSRHEP